MNRTEIMTGERRGGEREKIPEIAFGRRKLHVDVVKSISSADAKAPNRSPTLIAWPGPMNLAREGDT
jgi:hypothetical protein